MTTENSDANTEQVTQADLEGFATKLDQWGESLDPSEKAVLALLLSNAKDQGDVEGYFSQSAYAGNFSNFAVSNYSSLIASGIGYRGFAGKGDNWLNMGWMKSGMPVSRPMERF